MSSMSRDPTSRAPSPTRTTGSGASSTSRRTTSAASAAGTWKAATTVSPWRTAMPGRSPGSIPTTVRPDSPRSASTAASTARRGRSGSAETSSTPSGISTRSPAATTATAVSSGHSPSGSMVVKSTPRSRSSVTTPWYSSKSPVATTITGDYSAGDHLPVLGRRARVLSSCRQGETMSPATTAPAVERTTDPLLRLVVGLYAALLLVPVAVLAVERLVTDSAGALYGAVLVALAVVTAVGWSAGGRWGDS